MTPTDPTLPAVGKQANRTDADLRLIQTTALDPNQPWPFGAKPIKETTDDLPEATW